MACRLSSSSACFSTCCLAFSSCRPSCTTVTKHRPTEKRHRHMDLALVLALLTPPFAAGLLALVMRREPGRVAWLNATTMPVSFAAAIAIALRLAAGGAPGIVGDMWRLDALSALLALLVSRVAPLAA